MDRRGSGSTRYSGELAASAAGNIVSRRVWQPVLAKCAPVFLPEEPPSLTEKPGKPVYKVAKSQTTKAILRA